MERETNATAAHAIMNQFADRTGLTNPDNPPRRYLWTDAHAVCNLFSLYATTGNEEYKKLALVLIDQVHEVLGKHREDDHRRGWISGLNEKEGKRHPTAGGLRIGKLLKERASNDAYDERLEWERDGQYFHYLTKWMHALYKAALVTRDSRYEWWAIELAKAAHSGFTTDASPGGNKRLVWKMSIDLSYPLVPSTGLHDLLDGYVTYNEVSLGLVRFAIDELADLNVEIRDTAVMIDGQHWATDDSLGIGGLLFDVNRLIQLIAASHLDSLHIAESLIEDISTSIAAFVRHGSLEYPANNRLAFRELGLSIGLHAVEKIRHITESEPELFGSKLAQGLGNLGRYLPLSKMIEEFWGEPENQHSNAWVEHLDINEVMLATSILPDEFLSIS